MSQGSLNVIEASVVWDFVTVLFVFYDMITLPLQADDADAADGKCIGHP